MLDLNLLTISLSVQILYMFVCLLLFITILEYIYEPSMTYLSEQELINVYHSVIL